MHFPPPCALTKDIRRGESMSSNHMDELLIEVLDRSQPTKSGSQTLGVFVPPQRAWHVRSTQEVIRKDRRKKGQTRSSENATCPSVTLLK